MEKTNNEYMASTIVNGNEVKLITRDKRYFIHWGEAGKLKAEQELLTATGRRPSKSSAHKKFIQACEAAQYLKFSKL
jgi:hypothetical protein